MPITVDYIYSQTDQFNGVYPYAEDFYNLHRFVIFKNPWIYSLFFILLNPVKLHSIFSNRTKRTIFSTKGCGVRCKELYTIHLCPQVSNVMLSARMLEPMGQKELAEYRIFAGPLKAKIPSEFETFLGNPDFEVLGSVLAMQVHVEKVIIFYFLDMKIHKIHNYMISGCVWNDHLIFQSYTFFRV